MKYVVLCVVLAFAGCNREPSRRVQGYVEGEFVQIAAPLSGQLQELFVKRGGEVEAGAPLFALERGAELAGRDEAARRLEQAESTLADARRGQRPSEIDALEAQIELTQAALELSQKEFNRQEKLVGTGASAKQELDRTRSVRDQDLKSLARARANLETARLGSREDQIAAAEATVRAQEAALSGAAWRLDQKEQAAPEGGLVFDTLYRKGDWVAAGRPVVSLLPPENITVRAFVPQGWIATVHPGDAVSVFVDGLGQPVPGRVTYIAPRAEFTPPVIYSNEARQKLVFMVQIEFEPAQAATLHPGQPVDVEFR